VTYTLLMLYEQVCFWWTPILLRYIVRMLLVWKC